MDKWLAENMMVIEERPVEVREEEGVLEGVAGEEGAVEIAVERSIVEEPVQEVERERYVGYEWFRL